LKIKWAFGFPGATALYGQTIVDGRVFVSSNAGYVYALDAETGCIHWSFKSLAVVRSGITIGPLKRRRGLYGPVRRRRLDHTYRRHETPGIVFRHR
jgi:polyvinyl alcohol dehydrogenase (cytochrome)